MIFLRVEDNNFEIEYWEKMNKKTLQYIKLKSYNAEAPRIFIISKNGVPWTMLIIPLILFGIFKLSKKIKNQK